MAARRAMESITLDRGESHLKDELSPRYAELVYNGFWFSPERLALQAAVDTTQQYVTGVVRVKLYKARADASVVGALRRSGGDSDLHTLSLWICPGFNHWCCWLHGQVSPSQSC